MLGGVDGDVDHGNEVADHDEEAGHGVEAEGGLAEGVPVDEASGGGGLGEGDSEDDGEDDEEASEL